LPRVLIEGPLADGTLEVVCDATLQHPGAYYLITPQSRIDAPEVSAFRDWLLREVADNHPA
jgi:DNA-binding transcriptional LysR family regulator